MEIILKECEIDYTLDITVNKYIKLVLEYLKCNINDNNITLLTRLYDTDMLVDLTEDSDFQDFLKDKYQGELYESYSEMLWDEKTNHGTD